MYFILHHSKGALMLDAEDRHQVLVWSKRQLGERAGMVSVVELEEDSPSDWVERSGTGVTQQAVKACKPTLSFMADSVQRVSGIDHELIRSVEWYRTPELRTRSALVH